MGSGLDMDEYISESRTRQCMWSGCRLPNAGGCHRHRVSWLFPPQAARFTVASGEKGLWVVWYSSDVARLRNKGGKSALARFKNALGLLHCTGGEH